MRSNNNNEEPIPEPADLYIEHVRRRKSTNVLKMVVCPYTSKVLGSSEPDDETLRKMYRSMKRQWIKWMLILYKSPTAKNGLYSYSVAD